MSSNNMGGVFAGDAFTLETLTAEINHIEIAPMAISARYNWEEKGINTLTANIEERSGVLALVAIGERGTIGQAVASRDRNMLQIAVPHYPQYDAILATEVQGVRKFGTTDVMETVESVRNEKLVDMRTRHELTHEFAKIGALQGVLRDSNGSVYRNWYQEFRVEENVYEIDITDPTIDLRSELINAKRRAEAELGGHIYRGFDWTLPPEMFDAATQHDSIKTAFDRYQDGAFFRADNRKGFKLADDVTIFSYEPNTQINGVKFFDENESLLIPDADGLFKVRYAPADTLATANTIGIPFYAMSELMKFDKGVELASESNFVAFNIKPRTVVKVRWK